MDNTEDETIIRTPTKYWVLNIGAISFILGLLILIPFMLGSMIWGIVDFGLLILLIPAGVQFVRNGKGSRQIFNITEMIFEYPTGDIRIAYNEVQAICINNKSNIKKITVYTENGTQSLPSVTWDLDLVREQLKKHLPEEVMQPLAYQKSKAFLELRDETYQAVTNKGMLKVKFGRFNQKVGGFSLVFGLILLGINIFSSLRLTDVGIAGLLFIILGLLSIFLCLGTIEADRECIKVRKQFHAAAIQWKEVQKQLMSSNNGAMSLIGDHVRLIIPAISSWSGPDEADLLNLIRVELETRNIETSGSMKPELWWSKQ
jgi:hypothetical protein